MATADEKFTAYIAETHPWIDTESEFWVAYSNMLRGQFDTVDAAIGALSSYLSSGRPLRREAESWKLFLSGTESDATILDLLQNVYKIHSQRGLLTDDIADPEYEYGIAFDVETLTGAVPLLQYRDDLEWALDLTFPGQEESPILFSTLSAGMTSSSTSSFGVVSGTSFPTRGFIQIDDEILEYVGKSGNTLGTTSVRRGVLGTANVAHDAGDRVLFLSAIGGPDSTWDINASELTQYLYNTLCLGIPDGLVIRYANESDRTDREVEGIIIQEFVPPLLAVDLQRFANEAAIPAFQSTGP